jgi:hypothetical protein
VRVLGSVNPSPGRESTGRRGSRGRPHRACSTPPWVSATWRIKARQRGNDQRSCRGRLGELLEHPAACRRAAGNGEVRLGTRVSWRPPKAAVGREAHEVDRCASAAGRRDAGRDQEEGIAPGSRRIIVAAIRTPPPTSTMFREHRRLPRHRTARFELEGRRRSFSDATREPTSPRLTSMELERRGGLPVA